MGIIDSLSRFIGIPPEPEMDEGFEPEIRESFSLHKTPETLDFPAERMPRFASIQVVKPRLNADGFKSYSIRHYADLLKEHNALILDITDVADSRLDYACRMIDFLAGVTLALGGSSREINPNMFLFAPSNFIIGGDMEPIESEYES
ncbi:cell division protein SepF [bacterium]|nr:cell division protein SepF [bacterium]